MESQEERTNRIAVRVVVAAVALVCFLAAGLGTLAAHARPTSVTERDVCASTLTR